MFKALKTIFQFEIFSKIAKIRFAIREIAIHLPDLCQRILIIKQENFSAKISEIIKSKPKDNRDYILGNSCENEKISH